MYIIDSVSFFSLRVSHNFLLYFVFCYARHRLCFVLVDTPILLDEDRLGRNISTTCIQPIIRRRSMSKQSLQKAASERSGVSFEESTEATSMQPSLYERIGVEGIRELSTCFYDKVFQDKEAAWFLNIFSSSTRSEAIENQYLFFVQTFGGPNLYQAKKGKYTRLVGRHANYNIGVGAADRWVFHMLQAIQEHPLLAEDMEAKQNLEKYFRYTAHYIVVAMEYMRPDQVSLPSLLFGLLGHPYIMPHF